MSVCMHACVCMHAFVCVCVCVCVCVHVGMSRHMYVLRIVSTDEILPFLNAVTVVIISLSALM